jgi:SAM-dependent methyltransferase
MDLRACKLSANQVERAAAVLNYQPFIITDDLQTGAAYSWLHSPDPRVSPPFVFRRSQWNEEWDKVATANAALRRMYDDFVDEIATRYPGGSLFDVACNNGYFPVRAEMRGMRNCVGSDFAKAHAAALNFLDDVLGTRAAFQHAPYDPVSGRIPVKGRFDVVIASAILCHLPNPLRFLASLGAIANEAIFFWGQNHHALERLPLSLSASAVFRLERN